LPHLEANVREEVDDEDEKASGDFGHAVGVGDPLVCRESQELVPPEAQRSGFFPSSRESCRCKTSRAQASQPASPQHSFLVILNGVGARAMRDFLIRIQSATLSPARQLENAQQWLPEVHSAGHLTLKNVQITERQAAMF
jgi:hypothetical protein